MAPFVPEDIEDGDAGLVLRVHDPLEDGSLGDLHADPQADEHEHDAADERHAPAPGGERRRVLVEAHDEEDRVGGDESDRRAELGNMP